MAWLRIATAALVLAVWRRPWRQWNKLDGPTRRLVVAWAIVLAAMNSCFYLAIDRLPLGTVAAIEFLPVIALAAVAVRSVRNTLALLQAIAGVYLLTDVRFVLEPLGITFAFANAALFTAYIMIGHRASRSPLVSGIDGLAIAMLVAAVLALPIGLTRAMPALTDGGLIAAGFGVGVCSSVIPYVAARLPRPTYALMLALLPAAATVIGLVVLAQVPTLVEAAGVALVVAAVASHKDRRVS